MGRGGAAQGDLHALIPAVGCIVFLCIAVAAAHPLASPLSPDHAGGESSWSWLYLGAMLSSFALYLVGLAVVSHRGLLLAATLAVAACIQLVPLAGPLLLSTDVYTYWAYARTSAIHGENPYSVPPSAFPEDPAYERMGADWRDTTTVYGPEFTLASEGLALAAGNRPGVTPWLYRGLAAAAMLAITALAARIAERRSLAAAFVGWNPLLAVHFAGGGHNDVWMMVLVLAALALAAAGRRQLAGVAWAMAIFLKWIPVIFLVLRAIEARAVGRSVRHAGFAIAAIVLAVLAFWRYGSEWIGSAVPLARNFERQAVYSIPHRLSTVGIPEHAAAIALGVLFVLAFIWLALEARRGRARLALAAGLLLVATPWLVPWYAAWAIPLAAVEEDRAARVLALVLSAYLLRDAVPL